MTAADRLQALREYMRQQNLAAVIVPTADTHLSEYLDRHFKLIPYLSGFTGSAGTLVVTENRAALWTDSRYWEQAAAQLNDGIILMKDGDADTPDEVEWLADLPPEGDVGADSSLFSSKAWKKLSERVCRELNATLRNADPASVWSERVSQTFSEIYEHTVSPRSRKEKLSAVAEKIRTLGGDALLLASLDDIAWVMNLRGSDIPHTPVFYSYALVRSSGEAELFVKEDRVSSELAEKLASDGVTLRSYGAVQQEISALKESNSVLLFDPTEINAKLADTEGIRTKEITSPIILLKACKTPEEIDLIARSMELDGAALVRFFCWLETAKESGKETELSVAAKLLEYRQAMPGFTDVSFDTIAAFGLNGALPHYQATEKQFSEIRGDGFLLIDSGAQFPGGTTDITRTIPVGAVTDEMIQDYTAVLRGHIRLATAKFPEGISSQAIDAIAREPLWNLLCDYGHGTGHGVGFFLNVHEGPQRISYPRLNGKDATVRAETAMRVGMVTSDEPGLYRPGRWGIRIENLVANEAAGSSEFGSFLQFRTLTLCPYELSCCDTSKLLPDEKAWLNAYHEEVRTKLSPFFADEPEVLGWLINKTHPI